SRSCTGSGRSRPSFWRKSSICAREAVSPASRATGSEGVTREMRKTMATRPASVGASQATRTRMSATIRITLLPGYGAERAYTAPLRAKALASVPASALVIGGSHLLRRSDRAENDALELVGVGPVPLGVVNPQ